MSINITGAGSGGSHSFRKTNVNYEENFIYFKDLNIPSDFVDDTSYIYSEGIGNIAGLNNQDLVYADIFSINRLKFKDSEGAFLNIAKGSTPGSVNFNSPVLFNNILNIGLSLPNNQAVKYYTAEDPLENLISGNTYFIRNKEAGFTGVQQLYDFTGNTHTFTTCGKTGRVGPNSSEIFNSYFTNWHGQFLSEGDFRGYQDWIVPVSGVYEITAAGASGFDEPGAGDAGKGAIVKGRVSLTKGETITIAVGQVGEPAEAGFNYGGSGGGTFVVRKSSNEPLFIAGGGSAQTNYTGTDPLRQGKDGNLGEDGGFGRFDFRPGGSEGTGGSNNFGYSAGGGGFRSPGSDGREGDPGGGSFLDGLTAELSTRNGGEGGFGGGGSSDGNESGQSGGAGGYSGGSGAGTFSANYTGGGGGSFITKNATEVATSDGTWENSSTFEGEAITNLNSFNTGEGSVVVELVSDFTSGNKLYPTAADSEADTNAIEIESAGNSFHALIPINYDLDNDLVHTSSGHGFTSGQPITFTTEFPTPDLTNGEIYYVDPEDSFSYAVYEDAELTNRIDFEFPTGRSKDDVVNQVVVNVDEDTISIPNHGFQVDQPVQYSVGSGTRIDPLVDGTTYYISEVPDANTIRLKNALDSPTSIDFVSAGTGADHSFLFLTVNTNENTLYVQNHGLSTGQIVRYENNGGNSVTGLTNLEEYYVIRIDNSTIRLTTDKELQNIVNLTDTGTGTHSLIIISVQFNSNTFIVPNHGFLQGELVQYDSLGQAEIGGLTSGDTYYIIFVSGDRFRLATSPENAESSTEIELTDTGSGTQNFIAINQTPDGIYEIVSIPSSDTFTVEARGQIDKIIQPINPRSDANLELNAFYVPSHGLLTGTKVTYTADSEGVAIGGMTDATDYYVFVINQDYFKLATTEENAQSAITIELTDFGNGIAHSFESDQLNGRIVGSGNVSVDSGSILVNGVGTSFAKILKVGDNFTLYPSPIEVSETFADTDVSLSNDWITITNHVFTTGDFVKFTAEGGVAPAPLTSDYYYYIGVVDDNTVQLYVSETAANAGTSPITFSTTGDGSGFKLTNTTPRGPIVRSITAIGSDIQITVDRPYSEGFNEVAYAYPTFVYVRPSGYSLHRPFDGGVEMSTGAGNSFGQIIRQTRKYFRYQSGKGIQTSFAINFKPSIDLESMTRFSSTQIECKTRRPHGLVSGLFVDIDEATDSQGNVSNIYNGEFQVTVVDLTTFRISSTIEVPEGTESIAYGFPQFHVTSWTNGALRSGMFDSQNGMFYEFDGQNIYAVRRSSTQQTAGTVSALRGSELIFGDKTQFTAQFKNGDNVVLRGQTYKIIDINSDTEMSVRPEYRGSTGIELQFDPQTQVDISGDKFTVVRHGLSQNLPVQYNAIDGEQIGGLITGNTYYADVVDANSFKLMAQPNSSSNVNLSSTGTTNLHTLTPAKSGIIATKTVDTKVKQSDWNIDTCDGNGPSGYNLDLSRIQMCYMDYSWYGAGKIRFGFKTTDGLVRYVHEFKHNNVLFESYFRSGNLPGRYEVSTGLNPTYIPSLFHWGTSVIMDGTFDDDRGYLFTSRSQTLSIEGTTTKSFAANGINLSTDLITSLTHGFKTGDVVQFQSIAADGFPGLDSQNPSTEVVGSNTLSNLANNANYKIFVNSPDLIHLAPSNATISTGGTVSRTGSTVTVVTNEAHNLTTGDYIGVYGITDTDLEDINGTYTVTVTDSTTFTITKAGTDGSSTESGLAVSEVINFTSQGNIQYTYFLYPDGSLNNTTGPNYQPLISIRLAPSSDSGLTGRLGDKDIVNRMQIRMQEIGISTDELVEVKLMINGRLNNLSFVANDQPSLVDIIQHTPQDTISGGTQIYNFEAEGGESGDKGTTTVSIKELFELSNSILGGDNIFPDGPDILTVVVSRLTGNPTRTSAKLTWVEAQA